VAIFLADVFYTQGPILAVVSAAHLTTAVLVVVMNLLVIVGLRYRQQRKTFIVISWYGPLLIGLYVFGAYVLFTQA
jgi:cation:H+ antiporter